MSRLIATILSIVAGFIVLFLVWRAIVSFLPIVSSTPIASPTLVVFPTKTVVPATATATSTLVVPSSTPIASPTLVVSSPTVQQPPTTSNCGNSKLQIIYLNVVNPKDASQPQIGHPSAYQETHVSSTPVCVVLDVPDGYVGIVGGFTIDKVSDGVYKAYGPGHIETVITDGFGLITTKEWAKAEFDFRVAQSVQYNWAHANVDSGPIVVSATPVVAVVPPAPVASATTPVVAVVPPTPVATATKAPAPIAPTTTPVVLTHERKTTGDGGTLNFSKGDIVIGVDLTLGNGSVFHNCYLNPAPSNGTVKTGVLFPWDTELAKAKPCN